MTWKNIAHLRSPYLVRDSIGISHFNVYFNVLHFNNILTLGDCVGERLAMEFVLRYWSYMLIKIPSFGCKVPLLCLLTKKWQLKWIGASRLFSPFVGILGLSHVRDCKVGCIWRRLIAWILWGNVLRSKTGKTESGSGVRQTSLYMVPKLGSLASPLY